MLNTPAVRFVNHVDALNRLDAHAAMTARSLATNAATNSASMVNVPMPAPTTRTSKPLREVLHQLLALRY